MGEELRDRSQGKLLLYKIVVRATLSSGLSHRRSGTRNLCDSRGLPIISAILGTVTIQQRICRTDGFLQDL